ncbi:MAG: polyprenyl synthetase, partial [Flammeovirgaceae bacterium]|nr:polyprenyl synthetase [Flammeovirgaceae bacterium]
IEYSKNIMLEMIEEAYSILNKFPDSKYKESLFDLLNYTIKRNI